MRWRYVRIEIECLSRSIKDHWDWLSNSRIEIEFLSRFMNFIDVTTCQRGTVFNGHGVLQNIIKTRHNYVYYSTVLIIYDEGNLSWWLKVVIIFTMIETNITPCCRQRHRIFHWLTFLLKVPLFQRFCQLFLSFCYLYNCYIKYTHKTPSLFLLFIYIP